MQIRSKLTVDVISALQTSHTYFTPPSPPRTAVFLRITPMVSSSTPASRTRGISDERGVNR